MIAYERLLGDAMEGERLLFARQDGVEAAWRVVDDVLTDHEPVLPYKVHTWGPKEADALIGDEDGWHDPTSTTTSTTEQDADSTMPVEPVPTPTPRPSLARTRPRSAPVTGSCSPARSASTPRPGKLVAGGTEAEARQVLANIAAVLGDCGARWTDVAKVNIFLIDMAEFPVVNVGLRAGRRYTPPGPIDRRGRRLARPEHASRSKYGSTLRCCSWKRP